MTNASGTHRSVQLVMPSPQLFKNSKVPRPSSFLVPFDIDSSFVTTQAGITLTPSTRQDSTLLPLRSSEKHSFSAGPGWQAAAGFKDVFAADGSW